MSATVMPLTFVNVDHGASKYTPETRRQIRAHVMREYAKRRRIKDAMQYQQGRTPASVVPIQPKLEIKTDTEENSIPIMACRPTTPSPTSAVGLIRADPFDSLPIKPTPYMHSMLDYCMLCTPSPGIVPNHAADVRNVSPRMIPTHVTGEPQPLNKWWVPLAMTEPALFHSVLLTATHSYSIMSNEETLGLRPFFHRAESIRLINEAVCNEKRATNDAIIAAILNTAAYEVC
jgi:hypothetical protein